MAAAVVDAMRNYPTGRVLEYNVATGRTTTLVSGLYYANGIVILHEEVRNNFKYVTLALAETVRGRIRKIELWQNALDYDSNDSKGFMVSSSDIFLNRLPGMPDNLTRVKKLVEVDPMNYKISSKWWRLGLPLVLKEKDTDIEIWVSIYTPFHKDWDPGSYVFKLPVFIRKWLNYLPPGLKPKPLKESMMIKYNMHTGEPVEYYYDSSGKSLGVITCTSEVQYVASSWSWSRGTDDAVKVRKRSILTAGIKATYVAKISLAPS